MQKAILQAQLSVRDVRQSIQSKVESDMKCTSQVSVNSHKCLFVCFVYTSNWFYLYIYQLAYLSFWKTALIVFIILSDAAQEMVKDCWNC